MKIFIDESGSFVAGKGEHNFSCQGALIVPSHKLGKVCERFDETSATWPRNEKGEIKGSSLDEKQVVEVATMLRQYDCLFEVVAVNLNAESVEGLKLHKTIQAQKMTESLTDKHHPNMIQTIQELCLELEKLSIPLYLQSVMLTNLISRSAHHSTVYYAQRKPSELGKFDWVIDAKDKELTPYEKWWRMIVFPSLQSMSMRKPWPIVNMAGFNYSYFRKNYSAEVPEFLKEDAPDFAECNTAIDIKKIMESLTFQQSQTEAGIQLVDILVNAVRRLLNGKLDIKCAEYLGPLMIVTKGEQNIQIISLAGNGSNSKLPQYFTTIKMLAQFGRRMSK